ncbi:MAG TPA: DCC1-like thiol-disulfide oxidoreductase family protein [Amycolatopsis sp.]|uniref:thiol-disulfide oxidoreductase DCC family protein n=1 Tax=Amycolatopsis sp. TaxID=37632 RepID=UPI002B48E58E|nr:DCC1-like thiol-disulfide oxidoreductase family protein [Amycolatopsis sp.]HKS46189.1 DCC1-like thiol-disulfide oxidoreductase family protein [Amycolatopsis sp.]
MVDEAPLLLFDSTCVMCSRVVPWIVGHERDRWLRFAALQSDTARRELRRVGVVDVDLETMYVIEAGRVHTRSDAVVQLGTHLRWPWRMVTAIAVVPFAPRDRLYRFVARNRHRWFGSRSECAVPAPSVRERFLA